MRCRPAPAASITSKKTEMIEKNLDAIIRDIRGGFGPDLCRLIETEGWSDIMVNPNGKVLVDTDKIREVPCRISEKGLYATALILASYSNQAFNDGRHQSLNVVVPGFNLRANFVAPPAVSHIAMTLRKPNPVVISPERMVESGTITNSQMEFLKQAVDDHKNIVFSGGTGCHEKGTGILMADGRIMAVEDIAVGDRVMGPDGKGRTVLSLHRGRDMMYRIVPLRGEPFVVNGGHILSLRRSAENPGDPHRGEIVDISVRDWLSTSGRFRHLHKLYYSPAIASFEGDAGGLPIPPYVLGILIGDASMTPASGLSLCNPDREVQEAFTEWAVSRGWSVHLKSQKDERRCPILSIRVNPPGTRRTRSSEEYIAPLRDLGLFGCRSGDKFIPEEYRRAPEAQRLELLAGILDTDGSLWSSCFDYISKSRRLAEDVAFVARSLGFRASVRECRKSCQTVKYGTYHRVAISGDLDRIPTRVGRKMAGQRRQKKDWALTGFHVVEEGEGEYFGFECDGDHRYVMGSFVVTHNSGKTTALNSLATLIDPDERIILIEDVQEIHCPQPDVLPVLVNRDYSYLDAIGDSLRQRPTRILIGECRFGNQALEMLKAWNTGHPGGFTTIHANNANDVFRRLDQLCSEVSVSSQMDMIHDAIDVVVQMTRLKNSKQRRCTELLDVRREELIT